MPLVARCDELQFGRTTTDDRKGVAPLSIYYGVNISPYKEPLEQFDPLLLANFWNRIMEKGGNPEIADFWTSIVFVAGKYRVLNLTYGKNAEASYKQWSLDEEKKAATFAKAARGIFGDSPQEWKVLTTDDFWSEPGYWEIVCSLVARKDEMPNLRAFSKPENAVLFGDIPKKMLGGITEEQRGRLSGLKACWLYLYAELAEALFLRRSWLSVRAKIGPQTEEEYDRFLRGYGIAIVQLKNPLDLASLPSSEKPLTPYIGAKGQKRFWGKDCESQNWRQAVAEAVGAAEDYPNGPLDQYRWRIALLMARSEEEFAGYAEQLRPKERLAAGIVSYMERVFGTGIGGGDGE